MDTYQIKLNSCMEVHIFPSFLLSASIPTQYNSGVVDYEVILFLFCTSPDRSSVQFSSVAQSCLTLCDPMNHSTPGLPVHHQLPEFTQTHVLLHALKYVLYMFAHLFVSVCVFSSVVQSCLALCSPMDCSTPGFLVHHQPPEPTQTHVYQVGDAI